MEAILLTHTTLQNYSKNWFICNWGICVCACTYFLHASMWVSEVCHSCWIFCRT